MLENDSKHNNVSKNIQDEFETSDIIIGKSHEQDKLIVDDGEYLSGYDREVDITGVDKIGKESGETMMKIKPKGSNFSCKAGNRVDKSEPRHTKFQSFLKCRGEN